MTLPTQKGCAVHDSILRCSPGAVCSYPACVGRITRLAPDQRWNRDADGWRGTPSRRDKCPTN